MNSKLEISVMRNKLKLILTVLLYIFMFADPALQAKNLDKIQSESFKEFLDSSPLRFKQMFLPLHATSNYYPQNLKNNGYNWQAAIDITWGPGMNLNERTMFFDSTWRLIDENFPAFNGLDSDIWQNFWNQNWLNVENPDVSISRGEFFSMIQYGFMELGDDHTAISDFDVTLTQPAPGVPLLICTPAGDNDHFGAGLTPLPDSTLLVYQAVESHPLGLVPGDIVLGYGDTLWKDIYPQLLAENIPMNLPPYHSTNETFTHSILASAGLNWHLFSTIDIVKYDTGDTLHLPTSLLAGEDLECWATEQMEIPGVHKPNPYLEEIFSWGYIEGTNIAYIYSHGWWGNEAALLNQWVTALDSIMYNENTEGIIFDDRTNWGTAHLNFTDPLFRLFDETIQTFRWHRRCSPDDHFEMCPYPDLNIFINSIEGEAAHFFDKPIAILTGPSAVSGGDLFPLTMTFHPMTKIFGKPTCGAFSTVTSGEWINPEWYINLTFAPCDLADNPGDYILRKVFPNPVDFPWVDYQDVWLTQDGVAQGRDDVVEAAIDWIYNGDKDEDGIINSLDNCPGTPNQDQADGDGDGIGDVCDICEGVDNYSDDDLDDIPYCYDNCPEHENQNQANSDDDSFGDACDNCPDIDNNGQSDADDDGIGDICDACTDTDNDGAGNPGYEANNCAIDNCPDIFNPFQEDADGDGIGDACEYICGDANGDETVNIGDAVMIINNIFRGGPAPNPIESGNTNCDDTTNIGDAVYIINHVFKGGAIPCANCL